MKVTLRSISQDMTKADLYKRRSKNKQRKSSTSEASTSYDPPIESEEQTSLIETIKNLKSRNNNSIERDVALIRANTHDTPGSEINEPKFTDDDDIPSVKPVEKTYAKSRSKLDDYIYIESSQGLDETEVAFPQTNRGKKSEESPVPRKRRKIDKTQKEAEVQVNGDRDLRSRQKGKSKAKTSNSKQKRSPPKIRQKKSVAKESRAKESRPTKESIENEKTVVTRATRKRKYEEITKPVLREKGQNLSKTLDKPEVATRKITKSKKAKATKPTPIKIDTDMRMTRSRKRRLAISLSPSEVKNVIPAFSFESDRRVNSIESNRSNKSVKPKGKKGTGAKKLAVRATRTRAARR